MSPPHVRTAALWLSLVGAGCASDQHLTPDPDPLPPTADGATLTGRLCAPNGSSPLALAEITVAVDEGPATTWTDGDGRFSLTDLAPGTWDLTVEKGSLTLTDRVTLYAGEVTDLSGGMCVAVEQNSVRIAVVTGRYDQIEAVLDELGLTYDLVEGAKGSDHVDFLRDRHQMSAYDILFFNCGLGASWVTHQNEIASNLRAYVREGGSIYASDWAYYLVEVGWPDAHDFYGPDRTPADALVGEGGDITAIVQDAAMAAALGSSEAELRFDVGGWAVIEDATSEVLLEATYSYRDGPKTGEIFGPVATRHRDVEGTVLFTSFHNEDQKTQDMAILLQEIILSL